MVAADGGVLANDVDADGDALSVSEFDADSAQGGSVVIETDGSFTYTPPLDFNGDDTFAYTADDGNGGTAVGTVSIAVGAVNDDPDAGEDLYVVPDDAGPLDVVAASGVLANDQDAEGDPLTVTSFDADTDRGGTVVAHADGSFTYTPPSPFWGEGRLRLRRRGRQRRLRGRARARDGFSHHDAPFRGRVRNRGIHARWRGTATYPVVR